MKVKNLLWSTVVLVFFSLVIPPCLSAEEEKAPKSTTGYEQFLERINQERREESKAEINLPIVKDIYNSRLFATLSDISQGYRIKF